MAKKKKEKSEKDEAEKTEEQGSDEQLEPASDLSDLSASVEIQREDGTIEKAEPELLETTAEPFEMPLPTFPFLDLDPRRPLKIPFEFIDEKIEAPEALNPGDLAVDSRGNLYIARGHKVIKIDALGGNPVTIAGGDEPGYSGDGGPAENALLNAPCSIAISGDRIFILDSGNAVIRVIHQGIITTHTTL